jgi:hypothetical protein
VSKEDDKFFPRLQYGGDQTMEFSSAVTVNGVHFLYDDSEGGHLRIWARWQFWKWADLLYVRVIPTGVERCWFQAHPGLPIYFIDYKKPLILLGWFTHPDTNVPHAACYVPSKCQSSHLTKAKQTQIGNLLRFISIGNIDLRVTYTRAKTWNSIRPESIGDAPDTASMVSWLSDMMKRQDTLAPGVLKGLKDLELEYVPLESAIIIDPISDADQPYSSRVDNSGTKEKRPLEEETKNEADKPSKKPKKKNSSLKQVV